MTNENPKSEEISITLKLDYGSSIHYWTFEPSSYNFRKVPVILLPHDDDVQWPDWLKSRESGCEFQAVNADETTRQYNA